MIRGLYSAATALDAATQNQDVTAYNLAHASTPGYHQRGLRFETFDRVLGRTAEPTGDLTGTRVAGVYHDTRPGPLQHTGQPLDLAPAEADQFFTLAAPSGPVYTRNGSFRLNAQGQIVSPSGYPLLGENGPLAVPPGAAQVTVASDGGVSADGIPFGRVRLARITDPSRLTAVGPTLYRADPGAVADATGGRVLQGYREGSNVQPADAMVKMIAGARYYEAAQRALRAIAESVQLNTRPQT